MPELTETPLPQTGGTLFKDLRAGDVVTFGTYEQDKNWNNGKEDIAWVVLETFDDGCVLLISQYILEQEPFNESFSRTEWGECSLRTWLNGEFYEEAFTSDEQSRLEKLLGDDCVVLLSEDEAKQCESILLRLKGYTSEAAAFSDFYDGKNYDAWWLRTSGRQASRAMCVKTDSVKELIIAIRQVDAGAGVRPVICIQTK